MYNTSIRPFPFLTMEEIRQKAPSVFDFSPSDQVSDKYSFISTQRLIDCFADNHWLVVNAKQVKSLRPHRKHHLTFINPEIKDFVDPRKRNTQGGKITLELFNSSDGKFAFRFYLGIFSFICENGLVMGSSFYSGRLPHLNLMQSDLEITLSNLVEAIPMIQENVDRMSSVTLSNESIDQFALDAYRLKYKDDTINGNPHHGLTCVRRNEDEGKDLWTIYNVVQENLMRGGFRTPSNKRISKGIKSIDISERINTRLWELTETYYEQT